MKIQMRAHITGTRDGSEWPAPGSVLDVPADEGARLCATGQAIQVHEGDEERAVPSKPPVRGRKAQP